MAHRYDPDVAHDQVQGLDPDRVDEDEYENVKDIIHDRLASLNPDEPLRPDDDDHE